MTHSTTYYCLPHRFAGVSMDRDRSEFSACLYLLMHVCISVHLEEPDK